MLQELGTTQGECGDGWVCAGNTNKEHLIFSRQYCAGEWIDLKPEDRAAQLSVAIAALGAKWSALRLEHPDSNEGRSLQRLLRPLRAFLERALAARHVAIDCRDAPCLHLVFVSGTRVFVGQSPAGRWPFEGGVPRLRLAHEAPSRSALKLEEAFVGLLDEGKRQRWLRKGLSAVDLGAAPGGWSWLLAQYGLRVTAIDNGPLKGAAATSSLIRHRRVDGFRYRPDLPVDWLVCDMVEQPQRVAALVADWLKDGDCLRAMFNLKLPMKRRVETVEHALATIRQRAPRVSELRARHLYHDRQEVTVFARAAS
ncbi:23S rRNA (cytidine(2498)-2'-O)-methyltransferase RlmM [Gammaproteobacteria bacterium]|nr:23S rRNA (cytidine(2498)-2'-O)-methyltransferase RlmM [Gammaproteobacteria bacterium]